MVVASLEPSFTPLPRTHRHLDGGETPIFTVVMTFVPALANSGPKQSLIFREGSENAKDDRDAGIELDAHDAVGDSVGDVLEMHGFAFDQDTDCDHCVEGLGGHRRDHCGWRVGPRVGDGGRGRCGGT
jgi:hypothetical protein